MERRGALQEGFAADLMIYDYDTVGSTRKFEKVFDVPDGSYRQVVRPTGIKHVVVNGQPIFVDGAGTGALPGRLIGNGGPRIDQRLQGSERLAAA